MKFSQDISRSTTLLTNRVRGRGEIGVHSINDGKRPCVLGAALHHVITRADVAQALGYMHLLALNESLSLEADRVMTLVNLRESTVSVLIEWLLFTVSSSREIW